MEPAEGSQIRRHTSISVSHQMRLTGLTLCCITIVYIQNFISKPQESISVLDRQYTTEPPLMQGVLPHLCPCCNPSRTHRTTQYYPLGILGRRRTFRFQAPATTFVLDLTPPPRHLINDYPAWSRSAAAGNFPRCHITSFPTTLLIECLCLCRR